MKKIIVLILLLPLASTSYCQGVVKTLLPEIGMIPKLDNKAQQEMARRNALALKKELTPAEEKELNQLYEEYNETLESVWDIVGSECSWYCGGGPYKVNASSSLTSSGTVTYQAKHAHDLSFKNAWVEGVSGYGAGEYLEYFFKNDSPRITEIKVYNGYLKSENAWKSNSRVKKLKVYVNNNPFAILELKDTQALQTFTLAEPLGRRKDGKDLVLKFEIMEIYKGDKFEDTALTEIYFDGIDVH